MPFGTETDIKKSRTELLKELRALRAELAALRPSASVSPPPDGTLHRYEDIVNVSDDLMALIDRTYRFVVVSDSFCKAYQRQRPALIGRTVAEVLGENAFRTRIKECLDATLAGAVVHCDTMFWVPDQGERYFDVTCTPFCETGSEPTHVVVVSRDVTDRRTTDEALRTSENRYRSLAEHVPDALVRVDRALRHVYVNEAWEKATGIPRNDVLGRTAREAGVLPELCSRMEEEITQVFAQRRMLRKEIALRPPESDLVLDATMVPEFSPGGDVETVLCIFRDITDARRAEEALRQSKADLEAAQQLARLGSWSLDLRTKRLEWSDEMYRILGRDRDAGPPTLRELRDQVHPDDWPLYEQTTRRVRDTGEGYCIEFRLRRPDGSERRVVSLGSAQRDADGSVIRLFGTTQDVTEAREAEEALRASEERYRQLFTTLRDGFALHEVICDDRGRPVDYRFLQVNPAFEFMTGLQEKDVIGKCVREVLPQFQKLWMEDFARVVLTGESARITAHSPELLRHFEILAYRPQPGQFACLMRDVTDSISAMREREAFADQMRHAQKLESLGVLAGGIAHDFNNIMTGVIGNADLAMEELPAGSSLRPLLKDILRGATRAVDLSTQMLAYSGRGRFVIEPVDLRELVQEMTHLIESSITKKAELRYDFESTLPRVDADITQMRQLIMNLIINAAEALGEEGGSITCRIHSKECRRQDLQCRYLADRWTEGRYVLLEVTDTGCGMDEETQDRLFDPFFTTKFTGRGLGLAAVLGIIRGHGGLIQVDSKKGAGSTFRVLLPVARHETTAAAPEPAASTWTGQGTVLLVDDEEAVRRVTARILNRLGFHVLLAADGAHAVEVFRDQAESIDVVLLDLSMPKLDGEMTFARLREIRPDVRVILSSGYSEQELTERFARTGFRAFLQKPYRKDDLLVRLKHVLEAE